MQLRRFLFVTLDEVLLEGFFHFLRGQLVQNAHAAVIDVQKLHTLAVNRFRCIDHNLVHELVDQFRSQCFQLSNLFDLLNESLQTLGLVCFGFQERLHLRHSGFQRLLFLLIGQGQGGIALVR